MRAQNNANPTSKENWYMSWGAVKYGGDFVSLSIWPSAVTCQSLWSCGYTLDITTDEA